MLTRTVTHLLPFVIVAFGALMLLVGAGIILGDGPPDKPVELPTQELLDTQVSDLPPWITVTDAEPDWINSTTVTQEPSASGQAVVYKSQIVPLKGSGDAKTAYVVHYDWPEFSRQFASLASEIESNGEFDVSVLPAIGSLQFVPRDAEGKYLFGVEREVVSKLLEEGFNHVQVIESGSRPATTEDAVAATLMGSVALTLGLFWIRFQRRNNAQRKDLTMALENAAWLGASEGVQRALVSDADGS